MRITNPIPLVLNSTDTLQLVNYPLTLANVKFVISNPKVNQTITFYSQSGTIEGNPLTVNSSMEFKLENINYSKITFSDPNSYNVFCTVQILEFDTQQEYNQAKSSADFSLVPINNSIITSPLDSNGYVQVDLETPLPSGNNTIGNVNIASSLPSGNNTIGNVNIASSLPSGNNTIGNVNIASSLPSGNNTIGNVNIASALPSGSNTIGNVNVNNVTDTSGEVQAFEFTTSSTANTATQLSNDSTLIEEITILASSANTATVNIGNSSSQPFPLVAGSSLTLRKVKPSNIYAISSSASQTLYVIYGGA
ncbi:MAG: hypothetical protein QXV17_14175 [Candidatus Micrarchaeaceae archaeon]